MSDKQRRCLENSKKNHKSRRSERLISPIVIALFTAAAIFISGFAAGRKYQSSIDNKPAVTTTIDNLSNEINNDNNEITKIDNSLIGKYVNNKQTTEYNYEGPDYQSAYEQVQRSLNDDKMNEERRKVIEEDKAEERNELNQFNAYNESMNEQQVKDFWKYQGGMNH